jgi:hypothetical protein
MLLSHFLLILAQSTYWVSVLAMRAMVWGLGASASLASLSFHAFVMAFKRLSLVNSVILC